MKSNGVSVWAQYVATIICNDRRKLNLNGDQLATDKVSVEQMQIVKQCVEKIGGVENLRIALQTFEPFIA